MTDDHRRAVMEFEAPPLDHQAPIYLPIKQGVNLNADDDSDSDSLDGVKKIAKSFG